VNVAEPRWHSGPNEFNTRAVPVEDVPALAPLLDAFARGTRRSRIRVAVIVCRNGHTLGELFPSREGLFILWQEEGPQREGYEWFKRSLTKRWVAWPVTKPRPNYPSWSLSPCSCRQAQSVEPRELGDAIRAGRKRVVVHNGKVDAVV
jgi:hypothetical protein